jgi:high-affinity nickel-transport protein
MLFSGALAAFALGLRHGADPDHLAAIDNLTRNAYQDRPWLSRFTGTLFASGHTVMVLAIAALVGIAGSHLGRYAPAVETAGTWISIAVLLGIATLNVLQLGNGDGEIAGLKTRLLPPALRTATSPWSSVLVGLLFGFGFETSSQIATYTIAFGAGAGVAGALLIGAAFCIGMLCTDTLDSVLVHRLVSSDAGRRRSVVRVWILTVTLVAVAVAAYEGAQLLGWHSPVPDLYVSAAIVGMLLTVFAYVFARTSHAVSVP